MEPTHSADVLAAHPLAEVTRFMADGPPQDDMTLLVAQRARRTRRVEGAVHG